jgi:ribosomal protein L31E
MPSRHVNSLISAGHGKKWKRAPKTVTPTKAALEEHLEVDAEVVLLLSM